MSSEDQQVSIRAAVRLFDIPPVHDALVIGRRSPIGCTSIRKALEFLSARAFAHIETHDDEAISDILVRESILRRVSADRLRGFVLNRVKPLMDDNEILHLDLEVEIHIETRHPT